MCLDKKGRKEDRKEEGKEEDTPLGFCRLALLCSFLFCFFSAGLFQGLSLSILYLLLWGPQSQG